MNNPVEVIYLVADLAPVGPTNQTLNIIRHSGVESSCRVLTLFRESPGTMIEVFRKHGIDIESLELRRPTFWLNGISKLRRYICANKVKIVHSYGVKPDYLAHYATKNTLANHIITLRNYPVEDLCGRMNVLAGYMVARIHLHVLKRCKYVVACSKSIRDKMISSYKISNITAIQNGVDIERFTCDGLNKQTLRKAYGLRKDEYVIISVGSFIPRKNIIMIIDSFIDASLDNGRLMLLGDGPLLSKYRNKYKKYRNVMFLGKQSKVVDYYCVSDLFVSASESEGLPNAVLEALACRLPLLLSNIPQHNEIVNDVPGCGEIFEAKYKNELVDALKRMGSNKMHKYSMNSSKIRESPLTMKRMGKQYQEYYEMIK